MRVALDPGPPDGPVRIRRLADDGAPLAEPETLPGWGAVAELEREQGPRWVLARPRAYRRVLAAGVRLARAHDVELVEGLLLGAAGRSGEPHGLRAAAARLAGRVPSPDPPPLADDGPPALFDPGPDCDELADLVTVHAVQQRALSGGLRLLAAAESAGALVAGEMHLHGLPWSAGHHDALLTDLLGPQPVLGGRPPRLAELAAAVGEAFGRPVNPDSPADVLRAFGRAGHELTTTRAWELRHVDHPAVGPLLGTRSCPGCTPPTGGRGCAGGCGTAGSIPSTSSAGW